MSGFTGHLKQKFYSLLSASIGFRLAALIAGVYPNISPIATDTLNEIITAFKLAGDEIFINLPMVGLAIQPSTIPSEPPSVLVTKASITNCCSITPFLAPSAFLIPISLVLSVTDTNMMFITPTPATRSEIPAIAPIIVVIVAI